MGKMGMKNLAVGHELRESPEESLHLLRQELAKNGKPTSQSRLSFISNWRDFLSIQGS
jgi:hypothetical protein